VLLIIFLLFKGLLNSMSSMRHVCRGMNSSCLNFIFSSKHNNVIVNFLATLHLPRAST